VDGINSYTCTCYDGFSGTLCGTYGTAIIPDPEIGATRIVVYFAIAKAQIPDISSFLRELIAYLSSTYHFSPSRIKAIAVDAVDIQAQSAVPRYWRTSATVPGTRVTIDINPPIVGDSDQTPASTIAGTITSGITGGASIAGQPTANTPVQTRCPDGTFQAVCPVDTPSSGGFPLLIVIIAVVGAIVLVVASYLAYRCCCRSDGSPKPQPDGGKQGSDVHFSGVAVAGEHSPVPIVTGGQAVDFLPPTAADSADADGPAVQMQPLPAGTQLQSDLGPIDPNTAALSPSVAALRDRTLADMDNTTAAAAPSVAPGPGEDEVDAGDAVAFSIPNDQAPTSGPKATTWRYV